MAVEACIEKIHKGMKSKECTKKDEIAQVGTISANNDSSYWRDAC